MSDPTNGCQRLPTYEDLHSLTDVTDLFGSCPAPTRKVTTMTETERKEMLEEGLRELSEPNAVELTIGAQLGLSPEAIKASKLRELQEVVSAGHREAEDIKNLHGALGVTAEMRARAERPLSELMAEALRR